MLSTLNKETRQPTDVKRRELGCIRLADVGRKRTPALCMYNILITTTMAKLADYIACSLIYHKGNKFEIDEERTIMPCIYEDSDEYIKEYWGDNEFIGKFPVKYKGKEVQVLVFKDYEEYFGVFKDEENKGMKTYIVVQEFSEPEKEPKIIAQFNERWQAEHYAWHHEGRLWVYEMSK